MRKKETTRRAAAPKPALGRRKKQPPVATGETGAARADAELEHERDAFRDWLRAERELTWA